MDKPEFQKFLKKKGKKEDVAERIIRLVNVFAEFLEQTDLDSASTNDLDRFIAWVDEHRTKLPKHDQITPSANSYLWAIRNYYRFTQNKEMETYAALLREARIKRKPFALKDFRGVDMDHIETLKARKIINVKQMLKAGKTAELRSQLAKVTGIPEEGIEELVRLSDLARIQGIKSIRARLYHDAGITSIKKMASLQPEEILEITRKFVADTGFDGIPPLPGEVSFGVEKARSMPVLIDLD